MRLFLQAIAALSVSFSAACAQDEESSSANSVSGANTPNNEAPGESAVLSALGETYVSANIENGARVFRRCQSCHTVNEGGRNMVGPNLYGMFDRQAGGVDSFRYSPAMTESGIIWTAETVDAYLANPRAYIPRNRMSFAGLRSEEDRRDVIAWLALQTGAGE